jgi:hypothetical protein
VAQLAGRSHRPPVELVAEDQAAADTGADRHHHRLAAATGRPRPVLGQQREVGVVVDVDRQPQALGHHVGEGDVRQRQIDRDHRDPRALIDQAGDPESDRLNLAARGLADLFDRVNGRLEERRLVETRYRPLGAMVDREVSIDRAGQ